MTTQRFGNNIKTNIRRAIEMYKNAPVQARASFWFLICAFLQKGISVISTPIFTRIMPTQAYGDYSVFLSWLDIVTIFVTLCLYYGVFTQGLVKFEEERSIFASTMQGLTLTMTLCWTIIYLAFSEMWNSLLSLTTVQMLAMLVMIWSSAAFYFWSAEQRVEYKYKKLVILTLVVSFAKPIVGVIFVVNAEDKATARILALAIVELIGYAGLFIVQMRRGKKFYSKKYWKYALLFNIPLIPHYLSQTVLNGADRVMIKAMVGSTEAGIYSLAYSISQVMTLFNTALLQTVNPWLYQKIKKKEIASISDVSYVTLILIAAVNLLLIAFAPEIVAIFAPKPYYDAIWVIPPIAMSVFFIYAYNLFVAFEFYYERTSFIMLASISGALLNIGLNYLFIKAFGYFAAGYTTLICYIVYALSHYIFMNVVCLKEGISCSPYRLKILTIIAGAFVIAGMLLLFTYKNTLIRYIVIILAFIVIIIKREKIISIIKNLIYIRNSKE